MQPVDLAVALNTNRYRMDTVVPHALLSTRRPSTRVQWVYINEVQCPWIVSQFHTQQIAWRSSPHVFSFLHSTHTPHTHNGRLPDQVPEEGASEQREAQGTVDLPGYCRILYDMGYCSWLSAHWYFECCLLFKGFIPFTWWVWNSSNLFRDGVVCLMPFIPSNL